MLTIHDRLSFTTPQHQNAIKGTHLDTCLTAFFSAKCKEIHGYYSILGSYENYEKRFDSLLTLNNLFREYRLNSRGQIGVFLQKLSELRTLTQKARDTHPRDREVEKATKEYIKDINALFSKVVSRRVMYSNELNKIKVALNLLLKKLDTLSVSAEALSDHFSRIFAGGHYKRLIGMSH